MNQTITSIDNSAIQIPANLTDPQTWDAWWYGVKDTVDYIQVYELLMSQGSPEAAYRAAAVAFVADDIQATHAAVIRTLCSDRRVLQLGATAFLAYVETVSLSRELGCTDHSGSTQVLESVRGALAAIQALPDRDVFTLEVQARTTVFLGKVLANQKDYVGAANRYGEALMLARALRLKQFQGFIEVNQFVATVSMGRLNESLALLPSLLARTGVSTQVHHDIRFSEAVSLFALGASDQALTTLDSMPLFATDPDQVPAMKQLLRLLEGVESADSASIDSYIEGHHHRWLRHALFHLARASELRSPGADRAAFQGTLMACLEECRRDDQVYDEEMTAWRGWIRGLCHHWLGQHQLAAQSLSRVRLSIEEVLDLRLMLAALKLEVCLSPSELPPEPIIEPINEIRAVFGLAEQLSFASSNGLARRMQRWHPTAAAFCAVLPEPVEALLEARAGILDLRTANNVQDQAHGVSLPPQVVLEVILNAWGLQAKTLGVRLPNLSEDQAFRRNKLKVRTGNAVHWRTVVSASVLAFGMVQLFEAIKDESYRFAAMAISLEFGVVPDGKTVLAKRELEHLRGQLQGLIEGRLRVRGFVSNILGLADSVF